MRLKAILGRGGQFLILGFIFFLLGRRLYLDWGEVRLHDFTIAVPLLILSVVVLFCYFLLRIFGWALILRRFKAPISYRKGIRIWSLSQLGKFIPGKVWVVLARTYLGQKEGLSPEVASTSTIWEILMAVTSAALIFLFSLPFEASIGLRSRISLALLVIPFGVLILHPSTLTRVVNFTLGKLRRPPLAASLRFPHNLAILLYFSASWICLGFAFHLFVNSLVPIPFAEMPFLIGAFALATISGFLTFISPAGLGVREGVLAVLLGLKLGSPVAILVSLLSRIWITLSQLLLIGLTAKL